MFSGKAIARALRAHMLVQSALMSHIVEILVEESEIDPLDFEEYFKDAIENGMKKENLIEFGNGDLFNKVNSAFDAFKERKKKNSRIAKLWLQYIDYVDVVKEFICAERTSNWYIIFPMVII